MKEEELIKRAKEAMKGAYAPYSHFLVGAAVLTKRGNVFTGCNIENASYGASCCAERVAVFKAISEGEKELEKIAVVSQKGTLTPPCGICRQVLLEFMPQGSVILEQEGGEIKTYGVKELLPVGFVLS